MNNVFGMAMGTWGAQRTEGSQTPSLARPWAPHRLCRDSLAVVCTGSIICSLGSAEVCHLLCGFVRVVITSLVTWWQSSRKCLLWCWTPHGWDWGLHRAGSFWRLWVHSLLSFLAFEAAGNPGHSFAWRCFVPGSASSLLSLCWWMVCSVLGGRDIWKCQTFLKWELLRQGMAGTSFEGGSWTFPIFLCSEVLNVTFLSHTLLARSTLLTAVPKWWVWLTALALWVIANLFLFRGNSVQCFVTVVENWLAVCVHTSLAFLS